MSPCSTAMNSEHRSPFVALNWPGAAVIVGNDVAGGSVVVVAAGDAGAVVTCGAVAGALR